MITIVYASRATGTWDGPGLAEMLQLSRARNAREQVTGMLLYAYGGFVQQLEGETDGVERIFASIARDPRHTDLRVLSRRSITQRRYGAWAMGAEHPYAESPRGSLLRFVPSPGYPLVHGELITNAETAENLLAFLAAGQDGSAGR